MIMEKRRLFQPKLFAPFSVVMYFQLLKSQAAISSHHFLHMRVAFDIIHSEDSADERISVDLSVVAGQSG